MKMLLRAYNVSMNNASMIYSEFEVFYHGLLKDIGNISETELQLIKTKLQNTCEKYMKTNALQI